VLLLDLVLAVGIEYPFPMPVQWPHDPDPREHGRAAEIGHQDQGFHRSRRLSG
jgi:hypothetical protein